MRASVYMCVYVCVVSSYGCHNKFPQTEWLKTTEIDSLTALEAKSPKSSCQQGSTFLEGPMGDYVRCLLWLLVGSGEPWLYHSNLGLLFFCLSQISLCLSPLGTTLVTGFRVHSGNPGCPYLKTVNLITCAKILFPNKVTGLNDLDMDISLCKPPSAQYTVCMLYFVPKKSL